MDSKSSWSAKLSNSGVACDVVADVVADVEYTFHFCWFGLRSLSFYQQSIALKFTNHTPSTALEIGAYSCKDCYQPLHVFFFSVRLIVGANSPHTSAWFAVP